MAGQNPWGILSRKKWRKMSCIPTWCWTASPSGQSNRSFLFLLLVLGNPAISRYKIFPPGGNFCCFLRSDSVERLHCAQSMTESNAFLGAALSQPCDRVNQENHAKTSWMLKVIPYLINTMKIRLHHRWINFRNFRCQKISRFYCAPCALPADFIIMGLKFSRAGQFPKKNSRL